MSLIACHSSQKNSIDDLHFHWSVGGRIPDISDNVENPGLAGPVTGISHGVLLVGGGSNFPDGAPWEGGTKQYYKEVYIFHKKGDSLIPISQTFPLPYKVAYSANATTDRGVVVAGGENDTGALSKVLLVNWDTAKQELQTTDLPDLPIPLSSAAIAVWNNNIYLAGGQNAKGVSDDLFHFDLNRPEKGWDTLAHTPKPVSHTVLYALELDNNVFLYLVGGRKGNKDSTSTLYGNVYAFNLNSKKWNQKAPLPYALSAQTGVSWGDSVLLVFSGDQGKTFHETEILLMKISREKEVEKREKLIKEKNELQKNHPGFNGTVLAYNIHQNKWSKVDSIPFPGQVTTTAVKWENEVVIPCGEIRAGIRTPEIVLGKILE